MQLEDRVHLRLFSYCTISEEPKKKNQKQKQKNRLALKSDWLTEMINYFSQITLVSRPLLSLDKLFSTSVKTICCDGFTFLYLLEWVSQL